MSLFRALPLSEGASEFRKLNEQHRFLSGRLSKCECPLPFLHEGRLDCASQYTKCLKIMLGVHEFGKEID